MEDCIFCKIINMEIPAELVFEDEHIVAFNDINPQAPIHILLIPKEHYVSLNEIPKDKKSVLSHILLKARQIALEKGVDKSGYRIVLNTARDSGQEVFHIHFHLLGGRRMHWPPG
ncbi:MAG: histidine triad nucleotide-binding protein [Candidatus Aminicenantes bacterium]|nr:histidine triad nucleotide-binding protein [Candidatus Aminicenantes bacterium]MDH5384378.1 histidine triad nucleotide-binding protein [Candidatus Aminicenantes bacterium]MDH5744452.1 histidine triad nucleotide-binding protein [Candidatus Aminicenantes bacterium]